MDRQSTKLFMFSYEGERTQCRDNRLLGEFELTGIPPMLRGQAELVTTFEVDANGLLKVSAQDRASGRKASISKWRLNLINYTNSHIQFSRYYQFRWTSVFCRNRPDDQGCRAIQKCRQGVLSSS